MSRYGEPSAKITVTYNGVSDVFRPLSPGEKEKVRREFTGGTPYFLCVGALHPRKNIVRLLKAFEMFKKARPSQTKLVLAGPRLFKAGGIFRTLKAMSSKGDVILRGVSLK